MDITKNNFFKTSDEVILYFEDVGEGSPILFIPGFMCTTKFWCKNVPKLSRSHRVITYDPRGYGRSFKSNHGNTIKRHALDVKELIDHLNLDDVMLIGWSTGGSVASAYCYYHNNYKLKSLGLLDAPLFPYSAESWNGHGCRNYNVDKWLMNMMRDWSANPEQYFNDFVLRVFGEDCSHEDRQWIIEELRRLPIWIGMELHMDYCHTDAVKMLEYVSVPTIIYAGNSPAYPLEMSRSYLPHLHTKTEFHSFLEGGHVLFFKEHEKFNRITLEFLERLENNTDEKGDN